MKGFFIRIICIISVFTLLFVIIPFSVTAKSGSGTESDPYITSDYGELKELMANASEEKTVYIKLGGDILSEDIQNDYSLTLTKENQNVILDLAGHSITRKSSITVDQSIIRGKNGTLTIIDSVGNGGIYAKGNKLYAPVALVSTDRVEVDNGTVIIKGGRYESEHLYGYGAFNEASHLYVYGGVFKASVGIDAMAGRTYIYGGEFFTTSEETNTAVGLGGEVELYNLVAYGNIVQSDARIDAWNAIPENSEVYIDNKKAERTSGHTIAGSIITIKTDIVEKIEVFIGAPVTGKIMEESATVPADAGYEIEISDSEQVLQWFIGDYFAEGTFRSNTVYRLRVQIRVVTAVVPDVYAEVNGNKAILEFAYTEEGNSLYWVEYTFPATVDSVLNTAEINVPNPVPNALAQGGSLYETSKYSIRVDWHYSTVDSEYGKLNGKPYIPNSYCYATFYINAKDIYEFAPNTTVTINGKDYDAQWAIGENYKQNIYVKNVQFKVPDESSIKKGDINDDGDIDQYDYILAKRIHFKNYTPDSAQAIRGDVDNDGDNDQYDYILIKRHHFGNYVIK